MLLDAAHNLGFSLTARLVLDSTPRRRKAQASVAQPAQKQP
jgi:hypothetical protein